MRVGKPIRTPILPGAVAAALLAVAACGRGPAVEHWFVDSLVKIFPDDRPGAHRLADPVFHAARNSHVNFQLALHARRAAGDLYVDVLPLTGPGMPIETASARWVEYVVVTSNTRDTPDQELLRRAPALFPDALMESFPFTVSENRTRAVWVTISVPPDQEPGEYEGRLRLRQGRRTLALIPYKLVVHRAAVPEPIPLSINNYFNLGESHLEQFYGCSPGSATYWRLIRNIARFLARYHQTTVRAHALSLAQPLVRGGALEFDFSDFERFVETWEAAGVKGEIDGGNLLWRERRRNAPVMIRAWVVENGRPVRRTLRVEDPRAQQFLRRFLPSLYRVLERRGWTRRYLQGILDEPHQWEREPFVRTARLVRRLMPGVRTIEPVGARQDLSYLEDTVDIWVVLLGTFDDKLDVLDAHRKRGGEVWFYTALAPRGRYPNRFIDYSLLKVRLLHWMNFKYGFRGFLHWGGNFWGPEPFKDTQPVINQGRTYLPPGDAYITYPNRAGLSLLSSIRLEQMREGIEDYALLAELAKSKPEVARQLADAMVASFTDYVRDEAQFRELYRRLLESF